MQCSDKQFDKQNKPRKRNICTCLVGLIDETIGLMAPNRNDGLCN